VNARTARWLEYEQTLNERLSSDGGSPHLDLRSSSVKRAYRPEGRRVWPQEVVWLPPPLVRVYGRLSAGVRAAFGDLDTRDRTPFFLHPQPPASHRRLRASFGSSALVEVSATPTASFRTVLAWRTGHRPVLLKLSLGARVGGLRRSLGEFHLASGVIISRVMDTIPAADRQRHGFDWFSEPAGVVETRSGSGWLLRHLPAMMNESAAGDLVPAFSLISRRGERPPWLVDLIRESTLGAEQFVVDMLLQPYVKALAYLMFEHGLHLEGHTQNVLFETDRQGRLAGRIVLRDLSDGSVSIALRIAKRKPFPRFPRGFLPQNAPFPLASIATDHVGNRRRPWLLRGQDTVELYGLRAFVWSVNTSLARYFPRYDAAWVEHQYLRLWQEQATSCLGVKPLIDRRTKGLATDEAIAYFLWNVDWQRLGAGGRVALPAGAEALPMGQAIRREPGRLYQRIECAWGDLFLESAGPVFFRPAF
jgi:hypothetical protein